MIKFTNIRKNPGQCDHVWETMRTVKDAVQYFIPYELGYGAIITEISPTRIAAETYIMGSVDVTVMEGTAEELKLIHEACCHRINIQQHAHGPDSWYITAVSQYAFKMSEGNPGLLSMFAELFEGGVNMKLILIAMLYCEDKAKQLVNMRPGDLWAIFNLVTFDNVSLDDAIQLAS